MTKTKKKKAEPQKVIVGSREEAESYMREVGLQMSPVFVYGTLRVGEYNYMRSFYQNVVAVKNVVVPGLTLMVLGRHQYYPYATERAVSDTGEVLGDLLWMEADDYAHIKRMELGSGYVEKLVRTEDGVAAVMFVASERARQELLEDGSEIGRSWLDYVNKRKKEGEA